MRIAKLGNSAHRSSFCHDKTLTAAFQKLDRLNARINKNIIEKTKKAVKQIVFV